MVLPDLGKAGGVWTRAIVSNKCGPAPQRVTEGRNQLFLSCRDVKPKLGEKWKGWYHFAEAGDRPVHYFDISDKAILRHANVGTTLTHYIVIESEKAKRRHEDIRK
jgi:hypothetical protein